MIDSQGTASALARVKRRLSELGPVAVAVSGGVDSMTLAWVAHRSSPATHVFHALSAAVPQAATERVRRYAEREGWNLEVIDAGELADATYVSNPADRCYFCKTCLYQTIRRHTALPVVSGTNLDDLADYRPGLRAAQENGVSHPFVESGIDKATVRAIARTEKLTDLAELPASPCLSSRVTTGIAIDAHVLRAIDAVERALWDLLAGEVRGVRCRIRQNEVAIQLESDDDELCVRRGDAVRAIALEQLGLHGLGGSFARIAVEPYAKGSAFILESLKN